MHSKTVLIWAWESRETQHIETLLFDSEEVARAVAQGIETGAQGANLYSRVRLFTTPYLDEVDLKPLDQAKAFGPG